MLMSYTGNAEQIGNDQIQSIVQSSEPIDIFVWP